MTNEDFEVIENALRNLLKDGYTIPMIATVLQRIFCVDYLGWVQDDLLKGQSVTAEGGRE